MLNAVEMLKLPPVPHSPTTAMSTDPGAADAPPSYEDVAADDANGMMQPTILVLAGQSIHAESAGSAALYQMNRGIASLSHATTEVEFERVEQLVKKGADGGPSVKPRPRHIYNLKLVRNATGSLEPLSSESPEYFIKAVSSRTIGTMGLKKSLFRPRWKALPVDTSGKNSKRGLPQFVKDGAPPFELHLKSERYEWTDGDGNAIAVEDDRGDQHLLVVTASLRRHTMDALVALWCCRIWQYSADHREKIHEGADGGKLTTSCQFYGRSKSLIWSSEKETQTSPGIGQSVAVPNIGIITTTRTERRGRYCCAVNETTNLEDQTAGAL